MIFENLFSTVFSGLIISVAWRKKGQFSNFVGIVLIHKLVVSNLVDIIMLKL